MLVDAEGLIAKCLRIELAVRSGREERRKSSIAIVSARRMSLPWWFIPALHLACNRLLTTCDSPGKPGAGFNACHRKSSPPDRGNHGNSLIQREQKSLRLLLQLAGAIAG